jgi:hypothetical protein
MTPTGVTGPLKPNETTADKQQTVSGMIKYMETLIDPDFKTPLPGYEAEFAQVRARLGALLGFGGQAPAAGGGGITDDVELPLPAMPGSDRTYRRDASGSLVRSGSGSPIVQTTSPAATSPAAAPTAESEESTPFLAGLGKRLHDWAWKNPATSASTPEAGPLSGSAGVPPKAAPKAPAPKITLTRAQYDHHSKTRGLTDEQIRSMGANLPSDFITPEPEPVDLAEVLSDEFHQGLVPPTTLTWEQYDHLKYTRGLTDDEIRRSGYALPFAPDAGAF